MDSQRAEPVHIIAASALPERRETKLSTLLIPSDEELVRLTGMDIPEEIEIDEEIDDDPSIISPIDLA
jgi:hypothetical protein